MGSRELCTVGCRLLFVYFLIRRKGSRRKRSKLKLSYYNDSKLFRAKTYVCVHDRIYTRKHGVRLICLVVRLLLSGASTRCSWWDFPRLLCARRWPW